MTSSTFGVPFCVPALPLTRRGIMRRVVGGGLVAAFSEVGGMPENRAAAQSDVATPVATPSLPATLSDATLRDFEADIEAALQTFQVPGAAVSLVQGDRDRLQPGLRRAGPGERPAGHVAHAVSDRLDHQVDDRPAAGHSGRRWGVRLGRSRRQPMAGIRSTDTRIDAVPTSPRPARHGVGHRRVDGSLTGGGRVLHERRHRLGGRRPPLDRCPAGDRATGYDLLLQQHALRGGGIPGLARSRDGSGDAGGDLRGASPAAGVRANWDGRRGDPGRSSTRSETTLRSATRRISSAIPRPCRSSAWPVWLRPAPAWPARPIWRAT